ncbi:MAG: hypothetical protein JNM17_40470 [Archangium sp.]|nr:hypothetical protein [Archangium sp.]
MASDLKGALFVTGVMLGIPWVIWTIQNAFRKANGLPPAEVGRPIVLGDEVVGRDDSDTSV